MPLETHIQTAPLNGPLYARCTCGMPLRLLDSGYWALCACGRAVRFVGELQVVENADQWARCQP